MDKVVSAFGKNPKVSIQLKLPFVSLGKTKRSKEEKFVNYKQLKLTEMFQKPKKVKRKLVISSSEESEDVSEKISTKDDEDSPLEDCPSLDEEASMDQNNSDTVLAAGPEGPSATSEKVS